MPAINMHEAKTQFSKSIDSKPIEAVARGEEAAIAEAGKPAARMVPVQAGSRPGSPAC